MSDIKIAIGADVSDLNRKLAQAGGVTQEFARKVRQTWVGLFRMPPTDL